MNIKEIGELKFMEFDIFKQIDFINCCISTKHGGVSENDYKSMNLSFTIGDKEEDVYENYRIFSEKLNFTYNNIQRGFQTHSTDYKKIGKNDVKKFSANAQFPSTDILFTKEKNVPLVTLFADCVPLFLVDKKNKAVCVVHAGWKGTVNEIATKAAFKMKDCFGTKKDDLIVGIGPSIQSCCFLVDDDVYSVFNKVIEYRPFIKKVGEKYSINLQEINKLNLLKSGMVLEENIEISQDCTCCNADLFFSHRRDNLNRGSMAGFIEIIN